MIVLVYLIVLLRGLRVPTIFRMEHPYITLHSLERVYAVARMRNPTALRLAITC